MRISDWSSDVCSSDLEAITAREARGETLENRLIRIDSAKITAIETSRGEARITVRYHADISAITRDADGKLIAGSMSDAEQADDLWTFRRQIGSNDPNWVLDEAASARTRETNEARPAAAGLPTQAAAAPP